MNISKKINENHKKFLSEILAVVLGVSAAFIPPPIGLTVHSMWVIGLMVWAIVNWMLRPIPEYAAALIMCCMWGVFGIMPFQDIFSEFGSPTMWLIIGVLGMGAAITKSGLLGRLTLSVMKLFPTSFNGQIMAVITTGVLVAPLIPSTTAKVSIAAPIVSEVGDTLGLEKRSSGMSGLLLAMYTGFSLTGPMFFSASYFGGIVLGSFSEEFSSRFTWTFWFIAALPWSVVLLLCSYFMITKMYAPKDSKNISKTFIQDKINALGPMSNKEKITAAVMCLCVIAWIFEAKIGIPAVIPAVLGLCLLTAFDVFSVSDYSAKIPWGTVTFIGGIFAMAKVLGRVGINEWISLTIKPYMAALTSNPYIFVSVTALAIFMIRFVVVDSITPITVFTSILAPICIDAGIHPWIGAFIVYTMILTWVVKYQNSQFLIAIEAAGGEEKINHSEASKFCFVYLAIAISGLLISVPYWQFLGLITAGK